jgi:hypothetical protein
MLSASRETIYGDGVGGVCDRTTIGRIRIANAEDPKAAGLWGNLTLKETS